MSHIRTTASLLCICMVLSACTHPGTKATATAPLVSAAPTTAATASPVTTAMTDITEPPASPEPTDTTTASPSAATQPTQAPADSAKQYYIVEQNGRKGVVDELGKVVLPIQFSSVEELYHSQTGAAFFAVLANVKVGSKQSDESGEIYNEKGKKLAAGRFRYAYDYNDAFIQVGIRVDNSVLLSFLDHTGRTVVPCIYSDVIIYNNGFIGVKGESEKVAKEVDIYDKKGKLVRSGTVNLRYADGDYIIVTDSAGLFCGLMDDHFKVVIPCEWTNVRPIGAGYFIVNKGNLQGVIDAKGKEIIPVRFENIAEPQGFAPSGDNMYFTASAADGVYLFDAQWKTLFQSGKYKNMLNYNGVLMATDAENTMHALGMNGKELIPPASYIYWNAESRLFECNDNNNGGNSFYTMDGKKLPLPVAGYIQCITADRFLYRITDQAGENVYGLCNAAGKDIIAAQYESLYLQDKNTLAFGKKEGKANAKYGLMDIDGNIIVPAGFDMLYGNPDQKLYYAGVGMIHGLIDREGKWVWYTSDYDGLMD